MTKETNEKRRRKQREKEEASRPLSLSRAPLSTSFSSLSFRLTSSRLPEQRRPDLRQLLRVRDGETRVKRVGAGDAAVRSAGEDTSGAVDVFPFFFFWGGSRVF